MERIYFSLLREGARLPAKRPEDAGYDIYACLEGGFLCIAPFETASVPTGIASACTSAYYFQIQERGSTGSRGMAKRCGVIDSGYRGEWFLPITNLNPIPLYIAKPVMQEKLAAQEAAGELLVHDTSKAIAQALLLPVPETQVTVCSYEELLAMDSARGMGKLGSSGK